MISCFRLLNNVLMLHFEIMFWNTNLKQRFENQFWNVKMCFDHMFWERVLRTVTDIQNTISKYALKTLFQNTISKLLLMNSKHCFWTLILFSKHCFKTLFPYFQNTFSYFQNSKSLFSKHYFLSRNFQNTFSYFQNTFLISKTLSQNTFSP